MTRRPWFPLYVPDFLSKTGHLSGISSGAYLHLLMHQWMHESIPEDDAALARITRLSPYLWNKSKKEVLVFFEQGVNRRLNEELEKTKEISEKRSRAAMQMHLQVQSKRRHTNTNTNTNTNTKKKKVSVCRIPRNPTRPFRINLGLMISGVHTQLTGL